MGRSDLVVLDRANDVRLVGEDGKPSPLLLVLSGHSPPAQGRSRFSNTAISLFSFAPPQAMARLAPLMDTAVADSSRVTLRGSSTPTIDGTVRLISGKSLGAEEFGRALYRSGSGATSGFDGGSGTSTCADVVGNARVYTAQREALSKGRRDTRGQQKQVNFECQEGPHEEPANLDREFVSEMTRC